MASGINSRRFQFNKLKQLAYFLNNLPAKYSFETDYHNKKVRVYQEGNFSENELNNLDQIYCQSDRF